MSRVIRNYGLVSINDIGPLKITVQYLNDTASTSDLFPGFEYGDTKYHVQVCAEEETDGITLTTYNKNNEVTSIVVDEQQFCDAWFDVLLTGKSIEYAVKYGDYPAALYFRTVLHKLIEHVEQKEQVILIPSEDITIA